MRVFVVNVLNYLNSHNAFPSQMRNIKSKKNKVVFQNIVKLTGRELMQYVHLGVIV